MKLTLFPRSLSARIALVILSALIASQLVSVLLFRHYSQLPRFHLVAQGYISHLKTIRAALDTLPPAQHREFFLRLREERGIRVIPRERLGEEPLDPAPNMPAVTVARERLREVFGPEADIFVFQRPQRAARALAQQAQPGQDGKPPGPPPPAFITKIPAGGTHYWVLFPQSRIVEQDFSMAWLGWGIAGGLLALAGALLLTSRVNRPLRSLAAAARDIGRGRTPPPVEPMGPSEVQDVAQAFNQMREDLTRQDQERATFLAGVSHDLRTPLSRLRLNLEMLHADPATRGDMERDIEDINGVIDQFMDFARDESREPVEVLDLNLLVRGAAERAERHGATVSLTLAADGMMAMRPLAMKRLIGNLLDNARKHAGGDVEVRTRREGGSLVLSVLDRGPGIPPGDVERLKQPFTRLTESRSGQSGAGLGLAIVERIARLHGGHLQLLPREGGGLEARVTMPGAVVAGLRDEVR